MAAVVSDAIPTQPTARGALISAAAWPAALVGVVALAAVQYARYWRPWGLDDSWITFRYARNIALGHGYVFNIGERVQGTSTPLYTLYLAGVARLVGVRSIPDVSFVTGGICCCAVVFLTGLYLARVHGRLAAVICAVSLCLCDSFMMVMTSGMETPLYCLAIVATLWALASKRPWLAVTFATLGSLVRLDGLDLLAVSVAWMTLCDRRIPLKQLSIPVLVLGGWGVFCLLYFGRLFPESFAAKQNHTGHMAFGGWMISDLCCNATTVLLVLAGAALAFRRRELAPAAAWLVGYVAAYSVASLQDYPWYVAPGYLVETALASAAAASVLSWAAKRPSAVVRMGCAAIAVELAVIVLPGRTALLGQAPQSVSWQAMDTVNRARYDAARRAAAVVRPGESVDAPGIGMIGWFTSATVIDPCGLVTPAMVRPFPQPFFLNALAYSVARYRPDYVFETDPWWPRVIREHYTPLERTAFDGGGDPFVLWRARWSPTAVARAPAASTARARSG